MTAKARILKRQEHVWVKTVEALPLSVSRV